MCNALPNTIAFLGYPPSCFDLQLQFSFTFCPIYILNAMTLCDSFWGHRHSSHSSNILRWVQKTVRVRFGSLFSASLCMFPTNDFKFCYQEVRNFFGDSISILRGCGTYRGTTVGVCSQHSEYAEETCRSVKLRIWIPGRSSSRAAFWCKFHGNLWGRSRVMAKSSLSVGHLSKAFWHVIMKSGSRVSRNFEILKLVKLLDDLCDFWLVTLDRKG